MNTPTLKPEFTTWQEFFAGLWETLTGKDAEVIYDFENLEVSVPSSTHETSRNYGVWRFNGTLKIRSGRKN